LAQLYDTSWGSNNPNLKLEKSKSWDVGFDKTFAFLQSKLGVSWFHNTYTDLISSSFATHWSNTNIAHAQSSGLGLNLSVIPSKDLTISTNYTYTKTRDDQGQELLRRPQNQF
jgi:vitamin B12 transporter